MPMYDEKYELEDDTAFTTDAYSTTEVNFGVTNPNVGRAGKFGMHVVVTTLFAGAASGIIFWVMHGAATAPTTKSVGRFMPVADLVAGFHFYVPGPHTLLQYCRAWYDLVSEAATAGKVTVWLGPNEDGAV